MEEEKTQNPEQTNTEQNPTPVQNQNPAQTTTPVANPNPSPSAQNPPNQPTNQVANPSQFANQQAINNQPAAPAEQELPKDVPIAPKDNPTDEQLEHPSITQGTNNETTEAEARQANAQMPNPSGNVTQPGTQSAVEAQPTENDQKTAGQNQEA